MRQILLFALFAVLSACTPQVTVTSQVTVTLAPTEISIPTQTPEPLSQAFLDIQEKFAETDIYTLTPLAIEVKQEDETTKPIEGIAPNTKDGTFTINHEGEEFIVELHEIKGQVIVFEGNNRRWVWDGIELNRAIELVNNVFDPEKLPEGDWEYFNSPEFLKDLQIADLAGLIEHPNPETVIYIEPGQIRPQFDIQNNKMLEKYGISAIFEMTRASQYSKEENRPWNYVGGWKTEIDGVPSSFFVERWENSDGTTGFQGFFAPFEGLSIGGEGDMAKQFIKEATVNSRSYQPGCFIEPNKFSGFASETDVNLYFDNSNIEEVKNLYIEWSETGIFDNELSNGEKILPISPARALLTQ